MNAVFGGLARTGRLCLALGAGVIAGAFASVTASAQAGTVSIDPGMTRAEVVSRFGPPSEERASGSFDYMYYDNDCGQKCGIDDLVVLEKGIVTDAVLRSKSRVFTGVSSSPHDLPPAPASHYAPAPIHASTAEDSAHPGGIVFEPRGPAKSSQYARVVPNHADSAKMASPGSGSAATAPATPAPTPTDTAGAPGAVRPDTAAPH